MSDKKKIAILGGGVASMTAAYYLTNQPDWDKYYEVTVYQMGWRLGGKGASGRNAAYHQRIQEHGLHVWGGFYENAFATMRDCYAKARRPPESPLRDVFDAFKPQSFVVWEEEVNPGQWEHWPLDFPANSELPGNGTEFPSPWSYIQMLLGWIRNAFMALPDAFKEPARLPQANMGGLIPDWIVNTIDKVDRVVRKVFDGSPFWLLQEALLLCAEIVEQVTLTKAADQFKIVEYLNSFERWVEQNTLEDIWENDEARHLYILMDLGIAVIRGMIVDGVIVDGFPAIDDYDLRQWLKRHGVAARVLDSAPVWAYYDYFFAYDEGDQDKPTMAAGMGLNHLLRLVMAYKGAIFWELQAGMGDVVFAPMYEVMSRRGVKFEFFHMVEDIKLNPTTRTVDSVVLAKQVEIKDGAPYAPLVQVRDLACWPAEPHWDQIVDGEAKRDAGYNYEDRFSDWSPASMVELVHGQDFDYAVLGISIGEFPYIAKELITRDHDWEIMVDQITTIQTIAMQLWFKPDATELGWSMPKTVMTGYGQPIQTWLDATQVVPREDWPISLTPGNISYYCGPLKNPASMPAGKDPAFGAAELAKARGVALDWLSKYMHHLFPDATVDGHPDEVDWSLLVDPYDGTGLERFDHQYLRANYTPTERYVISRPGTNRFRMTADTSGYDNLVLCGDWLYSGLGGSVEGAVVTGMQASRSLCNYPKQIIGEVDRNPWQRAISVTPFVDLSKG